MIDVHYKRWLLRCDPVTTRAAYNQIPQGAPEICGCDECLNFIAGRDYVYPSEVRELFIRLGVDYQREIEVYYLAPLGGGLHSYGGWFHFVGTLEEGDDVSVDDGTGGRKLHLESVGGHFAIGFTRRVALLPQPFEEQKHVIQIEFTAEVPWTISRPEPD